MQEPGFEPGKTRPFKGRRYACSLLLHGAGGRIRTGRHGGLSTVAIPIRYASKSLVGRGRLELTYRQLRRLVADPIGRTRPQSWYPREDLNPYLHVRSVVS